MTEIQEWHRVELPERFERRIVKRPGGCWIWTGAITSTGYGEMRWQGASQKAHRLMWEFTVGPIPKGMCVCHHCDNPPCVKPGHLFLGTLADNAWDMVRKGRHHSIKGHKNPKALLSEGQVLRYRRLRAEGWEPCEIADTYRINRSTMCDLLNGRTWRHI